MNQNFDYNTPPLENSSPQQRYVTYVPYGLTPEEFEERREIKKVANTIGIAFLIVLAISASFIYILKFFFSVFNITVSYDVVTDPAFLQILQVVLSVLLFTFPFVLLFKSRGYRISSLIRFKKPKKKDLLPYFLLGISFCAFANMTVSFLGAFFSAFGMNYEVPYGENPSGILGFMLTVIATAVIPALVEEFACRGIILGSLRKFGDGFAIMTTAIVFGIMHGNFQQMPFAFLTGLVLGFITVKTKSIWIAVAVHFFNNFISVVLDYLFKDLSLQSQNIIYGIYLVICLVLGFVAVYLLKDNKKAYKLKKIKTNSSDKKLYKWFFSSATVVIFIIICLIDSLAYFQTT